MLEWYGAPVPSGDLHFCLYGHPKYGNWRNERVRKRKCLQSRTWIRNPGDMLDRRHPRKSNAAARAKAEAACSNRRNNSKWHRLAQVLYWAESAADY